MAQQAAQIGVRISGNSRDGVAAMEATEKELGQLQRELRQTARAANDADGQFRQWAKSMGDMRGILAGIGAAAGAAAAGLGYLGAQSIAQTADMDRLADALGVSVEGLQELNFAATQTGAAADDMAEALVAISDAASEAVREGGETRDMLASIGLTVADLRGKNPAELFRLVAGALADMENSTDRTATATALFGEDLARKLLPLLTGGRDVIRQFAEQAHRLGLVMSGSLTDGAVSTEQAFGALAAILDAQFTQAIVSQADSWESVAETLSSEAFQQGLSFSVNTFASLAGEIADTVAQIGRLVAAVNAFDLGDIGAIAGKRILDNSGIGFLYGLTHDQDLSKALFGGGKTHTLDPITVSPPVTIGIHGGTPVSTGGSRPPLSPAGSLGTLLTDLPTVTASAAELEAELREINAAQRELERIGDSAAFSITSGFSDMILEAESFRDVIQGISADLFALTLRKTAVEPAADFLSGVISGALGSIGGAAAGASAGGGRAHLMTTAMGKASGGPVSAGTPYLVGERGPELMIPRMSGSIIPNHALGTVAPVVNVSIDARGADKKAVPAINQAAQQFGTVAVSAVVESIQRGGAVAKALGR